MYNNQFKDKLMKHRKSLERDSKPKKSLLPMLLKFKDNGKTVDFSNSPSRKIQTLKREGSGNKKRETSYQKSVYNETSIHADTIAPTQFENDMISEVVRETMSYFHPPSQGKSSKVCHQSVNF